MEEYRINREIAGLAEVRLIGADGKQAGVVPLREAQRLAEEANLDLVEIGPQAAPPVCRVMNFGKFLYEKEKKEKEARRAQTVIEVKEIRLRPKTSDHHAGFKVRDARRWLEEGKKVRVRVRFRGREITHPQIARDDLAAIAKELEGAAVVEQAPILDGKTMIMVLAPAKRSGKAEKPAKPAVEPAFPAAAGG